ncbi:xylulokinase [Oceanispirochaeta sp.]|jgi:sugar (pentulose or hexulose) kinase|uniref:xylulokinase n=1 Tax=Oceanispirochaeta sp. TaxID=2035350 RepID=UPI002634404A|nr:FGGY-family carbohydrate kinase [Oceanispirochaeta sp.]MDA3958261.1 FGGY-family carbohydrate kinase [Oceanispirochaeta sp.]
MDIKKQIETGQTALGIELGSTRIKAVLINQDNKPIASGGHDWENSLIDGVWTYNLDDVWTGVQDSFSNLKKDVLKKYGVSLKNVKAIGFSGMMHGYIVVDKEDRQLTPFRTWRNNFTSEASALLTDLFKYNIPQRWSIAHLYQAILNKEKHVSEIAHLTTLAGYIHWKLTDEKVMGVGEASGMFPIDLATKEFDENLMDRFDTLVGDRGFKWKLKEILPKVLVAGTKAGSLTKEGALLLDTSGELAAGIPLCPPEGDAGTGMVATNSVAVRTGNVSAGTSVFAMLVLEKALSKVHPEIDMVTTPDGFLVGMAHSNNCTSDYDAWISLLGDAAQALGAEVTVPVLYDTLLGLALKADPDCGGLLAYGYISGEHMTGFSEGRPLFARSNDSNFTLPNFIRTHLFTALCALKTGLNILIEDEKVVVDEIRGHGGFFKTAEVGQKIMAAATNTPISILETAGEGGAWGIALLAAFMAQKEKSTLPDFLNDVFKDSMGEAVKPDPSDVKGFNAFFERYHKGLPLEKAAVEYLD